MESVSMVTCCCGCCVVSGALKGDCLHGNVLLLWCQERWRVTAEQAKAESSQRSLEEERRALNQHTSMEREELERAKVRGGLRVLGAPHSSQSDRLTAPRDEPKLKKQL